MMQFHYDVMPKNFEGRYNLIYSDTDSLVYNIQHDEIYHSVKDHMTHFDLSGSDRVELKDNTHKNVIWKFKDETNSIPITEFVAVNPKCYSYNHLTKDDVIEHAQTSKGVSKYVATMR